VHIRRRVYTDRMGACTRSCTRAVRSHSVSMHVCMPVHDRGMHACMHLRRRCACTYILFMCMHACMHAVNAHGDARQCESSIIAAEYSKADLDSIPDSITMLIQRRIFG
jgi:hypothetical protein